MGAFLSTACFDVKTEGDRESDEQYGERDANGQGSRPGSREASMRILGAGLRLALRYQLCAPLLEGAKPPCQDLGVRQAHLRIRRDRDGEVLAQEFIVDIALPPGGEGLIEVPGEQLIQDHAERIDVGLHREWLTLEGFGCRVGRCGGIPAGRSNGVREAEARDTESVDLAGVEHISAAEVPDRYVDGLAGGGFHKNIRWFQVL